MTANDSKLETADQAEDLDFNPFPAPPPAQVVRPSLKGTGRSARPDRRRSAKGVAPRPKPTRNTRSINV